MTELLTEGRTTRRAFLGALATATQAAAQAATATPPNIVIVLADDLGYGDLACYSSAARTKTPHCDRLAREGMRFTDAHSPSSVCTPTRYGLLTGRYAWRTRLTKGVLNGTSRSLIEPDRSTLASILKARGYRTGVFGKWHLGLGSNEPADYSKELTPSPLEFGFDEFFGIPASLDMPPYLYVDGRQAVEQPTNKIGDHGAPPRGMFWRGGPIAPGFEMDEVLPKIVSRACAFIRKKENKPFFAYVPLTAPHTPWVPAPSRIGKSKAALYGDFVEQVDDSVGQIVNAIRDAGAEKNTLVIVTSDNGAPWSAPDVEASFGHTANGKLRGQKADIYEAGHRVPFLVKWPGHVKGKQESNALVCLTDIFATIAAINGRELSDREGEDSFSFLPVLEGGQSTRRGIVHHSASGMFAIREGNFKLIEGRGSGGFTKPQTIDPKPGEPAGELYDLSFDAREELNKYQDLPAKVTELTELLNRWRKQGYSRPMAGRPG